MLQRLLFTALLSACSIHAIGKEPAKKANKQYDEPVAKDVRSSGEATATKALLIAGGCCHDYANQKNIISEALSNHIGPIDWTILQYAQTRDVRADVYRSTEWINGFDIVVHNECFGGITDGELVSGIVRAHKEQNIPAIVIHCSMHSYRAAPTADEWRQFLGVTSPRHEKSKQSMLVEPTELGKTHPAIASLGGENWETPNGELYLIEKTWPGTEVLATAHSNETNKDEPVIWTNEADGVRLFAISIGHHNETMLDPKWQGVLADGWKWALKSPETATTQRN